MDILDGNPVLDLKPWTEKFDDVKTLQNGWQDDVTRVLPGTGTSKLRWRRRLMILAVASGKGCTGKTTVAVNLAKVCGTPVELLDCDVENRTITCSSLASWTREEKSPYLSRRLTPHSATAVASVPGSASFMPSFAWESGPWSFPNFVTGAADVRWSVPGGDLGGRQAHRRRLDTALW